MIGVAAGFALLFRVPSCAELPFVDAPPFSIIVPARNEANNLPALLRSIAESPVSPAEVIVVNDGSTDDTATVANSFGVYVIQSASLPEGWTGKTWACHQGASEAKSDLLLFLDADTYFLPSGLGRIIGTWVSKRDSNAAVSVLPYHAVSRGFEQLSIFFNVLMAAGVADFGAFSSKGLFGQSLLVSKQTYWKAGGHAAVRSEVLENLKLGGFLRASGARLFSLGGRDCLQMRMFPEGFAQMTESWSKAFVDGAKNSSVAVLVLSILWISALWSSPSLLATSNGKGRTALVFVYFLLGLQLYWQGRQLGRYRLVTCVFYPIPLAYYCLVFGGSLLRRIRGVKSSWRGREV